MVQTIGGERSKNWAYNRNHGPWAGGKTLILDYESEPITQYLGIDMCKPSSYLSTHGEPYPNNY
jgi:hypothetical protein